MYTQLQSKCLWLEWLKKYEYW